MGAVGCVTENYREKLRVSQTPIKIIKYMRSVHMKEHIILQKAKKYDISNQNLIPNGCSYKAKNGYWVENSSNVAMMKSDNPQKPVTKKCDIETGEDQKGE